jgi:hypothetical protein
LSWTRPEREEVAGLIAGAAGQALVLVADLSSLDADAHSVPPASMSTSLLSAGFFLVAASDERAAILALIENQFITGVVLPVDGGIRLT